jgi:hypothetical protein
MKRLALAVALVVLGACAKDNAQNTGGTMAADTSKHMMADTTRKADSSAMKMADTTKKMAPAPAPAAAPAKAPAKKP